ncbi:unnamed protein product [Schistosoma rodhaini]|nr:unnamed protein product [Schistosoma rodhaini]
MNACSNNQGLRIIVRLNGYALKKEFNSSYFTHKVLNISASFTSFGGIQIDRGISSFTKVSTGPYPVRDKWQKKPENIAS